MSENIYLTLNSVQATAFLKFANREKNTLVRRTNVLYARINVLTDARFAMEDLAESISRELQAVHQDYSYNS